MYCATLCSVVLFVAHSRSESLASCVPRLLTQFHPPPFLWCSQKTPAADRRVCAATAVGTGAYSAVEECEVKAGVPGEIAVRFVPTESGGALPPPAPSGAKQETTPAWRARPAFSAASESRVLKWSFNTLD